MTVKEMGPARRKLGGLLSFVGEPVFYGKSAICTEGSY